jgi:hypothetical protein
MTSIANDATAMTKQATVSIRRSICYFPELHVGGVAGAEQTPCSAHRLRA